MSTDLERYALDLELEYRRRARDRQAAAIHTGYRDTPIRWAVDKLGLREDRLRWSLDPAYAAHQWDGDPDPLVRIAEALAAWQDVGVESGTGTGKSYFAAVLILWFLACWEGSRVFTFAPKEDQLRLYVWKELRQLWPAFARHFPSADLTDLCIRMRGAMDDSWGAHGYAVGVRAGEDVATKAAGMHAEHMLLVYEETPGIDAAILAAGEQTSTAPHNLRLAIGNPDNALDALHAYCTSPGVVAVRMSALDHPNVVRDDPSVIPGAVSAGSIERRRQKHGEDDPIFFKSRVRGLCPMEAVSALIRWEWLEAAAQRFESTDSARGEHALGVDVANSEHGDRRAIAYFRANRLLRCEAEPCADANALGRAVVDIARNPYAPVAARRIGVDPIGVGAGTVNEMRRIGVAPVALNSAAPPVARAARAPDGSRYDWVPDANAFLNLRAQMYWQLREDLRLGQMDLPRDPDLWRELVAVRFETHNGKVRIEPKDDIRARLGASPDRADAVVLGNWVRWRDRMALPGPVPDVPDRSMGYDYVKHEVRHRETADELVARAFHAANPNPTAGRHRVPRR